MVSEYIRRVQKKLSGFADNSKSEHLAAPGDGSIRRMLRWCVGRVYRIIPEPMPYHDRGGPRTTRCMLRRFWLDALYTPYTTRSWETCNSSATRRTLYHDQRFNRHTVSVRRKKTLTLDLPLRFLVTNYPGIWAACPRNGTAVFPRKVEHKWHPHRFPKQGTPPIRNKCIRRKYSSMLPLSPTGTHASASARIRELWISLPQRLEEKQISHEQNKTLACSINSRLSTDSIYRK